MNKERPHELKITKAIWNNSDRIKHANITHNYFYDVIMVMGIGDWSVELSLLLAVDFFFFFLLNFFRAIFVGY